MTLKTFNKHHHVRLQTNTRRTTSGLGKGHEPGMAWQALKYYVWMQHQYSYSSWAVSTPIDLVDPST